MAEFAIGAEGRLRFGGKSGAKFGESREPRARLNGCDSDKSDFKGHNLVWLERKIGKNERREIVGFDAKLIMARR